MAISLCMIVKDEEKLLEQCLSSVKDLFDEIIIVDTGSKDKTKEIAKKFTDNIFDFEWKNDFAAARNFSIEKAAKEWVFILDADESISKEDHEKIKILTENKDYAAYGFLQRLYSNNANVRNFVSTIKDTYRESTGFLGFQPNNTPRMFQNNKGIFYQNKIHEDFTPSVSKINGKLKQTSIPIHHYPVVGEKYAKEKLEMHVKLIQEKINENPNDPQNHLEFGRLMIVFKDFNKAKQALQKTIELEKDNAKAHSMLIEVYAALGEMQKADEAFKKAIELDPMDITAYSSAALLFMNNKKFNMAAKAYKKVVEINPMNVIGWLGLGISSFEAGNFDMAKKAFENTLKLDPTKKIAEQKLKELTLKTT